MMIWTRDTVRRLPRPEVVAGWLLLIALVLASATMCNACTNPCHDYYRFDGREPDKAAGIRPFYKVRECDGQPAVELCDDYTVLPTEHCR